jgi:hypothetical protein
MGIMASSVELKDAIYIRRYTDILDKFEIIFGVPWPKGDVPYGDGFIQSSDPNDLIRPVLESELGEQKKAWDWCHDPNDHNRLIIAMNDATMAVKIKLEWS